MTVAAKSPIAQYLENGVTVAFAAKFRFLTESDLVVSRISTGGVEAILPRSTAWSATGGETDAGGTVTLQPGWLSNGTLLRIARRTDRAQQADYATADTFPAESHEAALDRQMLIAQEQDVIAADLAYRSVLAPAGEEGFTLPARSERSGFVAWDEYGGLVGANMPGTFVGANVSVIVDTIAQMAALPNKVPSMVVQLSTGGRAGLWVYRLGVSPLNDPLQGLIAPAVGGGYFERVWDQMRGRPEWFGAITNSRDGSIPAQNLAAITQCFKLCQVTDLTPGDYYITGTLQLNTDYHRIKGNAPPWDARGKGARIIQTDLTKDVILIGSPTGGASGMILEDIAVAWDGLLTPPADVFNAPRGFNFQKCVGGKFRGLAAIEPIVGFFAYGTVYCKWFDWNVKRHVAYPGPNADRLLGFWVRGVPPEGQANGYAGGNASVYLFRGNCTIGDGIAIQAPVGIVADGDFADTYIDEFETVFVPFPIVFDGSAGTFAGGHGDVHIRNVVFDQGSGDGITIRGTNQLAKVQINGGYIQIRDNNNAGVRIHDGAGFVTIENLQILSGTNVSSRGVRIVNHGNVSIGESVIIESIAYPVEITGNSPRCSVTCHIGDGAANSNGTRPAVLIQDTGQAYIAPDISGQAGAFSDGVKCVSAARVHIDVTRIDAAAIVNRRQVSAGGNKVMEPGYHNLDASPTTTVFTGIYVSGAYG